MKLSAPVAGLFLVAIVFLTNNPSVLAKEATQENLIKNSLGVEFDDPINRPLALVEKKLEAPKPTEPPKPKEYIVVSDETLTKIAETHTTTWQRLYAKNLNIENPDVIKAGDKIIIPLPEEVLAIRALPELAPGPDPGPDSAANQSNFSKAKTRTTRPAVQSYASGSNGGNTYAAGYCTWYAKNRRPDLPNNLGNANTWVARAAGQGISTGSAPRVGAIGQAGNHVVYVEAVNGDGTIRVSEMNYAGFGVVSSRTTSAGAFQYIF